MRRGLASLILGCSLLVASAAWSGFVLLHTVLDPGRSESVADEMLDNTVLRGALVGTMADSIEAGVPGGATVPRPQIEAAAAVALDDPRVEGVVRDGLVAMHQNALNGVDEPVVIDPSVFGASARDALVAARPELGQVLPTVPPAAITLPDTGLSFLGDVRDFLDQTVHVAALAALAGTVAALVITTDRPSVLRRVAFWAFAASAFWLIIGYGLPWLAERFMPGSAAIFAAGIEVFLGAMIVPALLLAGAGVVLVVLSLLWGATGRAQRRARSRSRAVATSATHAPGPVAGPSAWPPAAVGPRDPAGRGDAERVGAPARSDHPADRTSVQPVPGSPWAARPAPVTGVGAGSGMRDPIDPWDRTRVEPPPLGGATPWHPGPPQPPGADPWDRTRVGGADGWAAAPPPPEPGRARSSTGGDLRGVDRDAGTGDGGDRSRRGDGPRWVEGVGYVDE